MDDSTSPRRIVADVLGYLIAVCLAFLLFPQIRKTMKNKHTLGLSKKTIWMNIIISSLGVVYSILIEEYPLLAGEVTALMFSVWLAILFIIYRENTAKLAEQHHQEEIPITTITAV